MRIVIVAMLALMLPACTSLLLGTGSSGDGGMATDDRSSAQVAEDSTISARIRHRFSADPDVSKFAIGIRTVDNIVTLSGTVDSFPARDRAARIATDTDGVRSIRNQIVVNTNL